MTGPAGRGAAAVVPDEGAVAIRIIDFLVRTETERLALFGFHLRSTVVRASPLLIELARMEQIDLMAAAAMIQAPRDWPWRPLPEGNRVQPRVFVRKGQFGASTAVMFRRAFNDLGLVIRDAGHPRGGFAIRPSGRVLGFAAEIGRCMLVAFGQTATLKLSGPLPETLMSGLAGRPIGGIVDHPLFFERDWRIMRVVPDGTDGLPVLHVRVPLVAFGMPTAGKADRW